MSVELLTQIRTDHARREQKLAICTGSVPLGAEERVELLAVLSADPEPEIADRAQNALLTQTLASFLAAAARPEADPRFFTYLTDTLADKPGVADALAKNTACPTAHVARIAHHLTQVGIQSLLDNLERFASDPQLVLAVAGAPAASPEQRELLANMEKKATESAELAEAAAEAEPDVVKRQTLMEKLAHMNVVQRLTLALKGGRTERMTLIRDPNKLVQRCVLQSPRLTDSEVEAFASMTNLTSEILRAISMSRVFMKNYSVVRNLTNNPKTPLDVSLHLFPRLTATDLVKLTSNKNVPETLRSSATKLHRKRKMGMPGA